MKNKSKKDNPIEEKHRKKMQVLATFLDEELNPGKTKDTGFCLLVFNYKEEGGMNYISNAERSSMVRALKEFISYLSDEKSSVNLN